MIRVSVTDIDALRYYYEAEDMALADLLSRLRKESPPTEAMLAGIALHKALEHATEGAIPYLEADGYRFIFDSDIQIALPELREIKAEKIYHIDGEQVTLVGKVDALHVGRVEDHKTVRLFDPERFISGYQWRFYLDIFQANHFRWNVFAVEEVKDTPKHYRITGFHTLGQSRYPGMEEDCLAALTDFVHFAKAHLPERFTQEAA